MINNLKQKYIEVALVLGICVLSMSNKRTSVLRLVSNELYKSIRDILEDIKTKYHNTLEFEVNFIKQDDEHYLLELSSVSGTLPIFYFNNYNLTHIIIVLEMYLESYAINNTHKHWYNFFLPKRYVIHCENYLMYFFFLHFEEIVGDYYIVTPISDKEHILQYEEIPIWTRIMRFINPLYNKLPLNNKHILLK